MPAHERVEAGMIHKTHKGLLFIDEISTLKIQMQSYLNRYARESISNYWTK